MSDSRSNDVTKGTNTYYDLFDSMTNNGRVFDEDLSAKNVSRTSLSPSEARARNAYTAMIRLLRSKYKRQKDVHPIATTKEEVLQQRVVAPCLAAAQASCCSATSSSRAGRIYPKRLHVWTGFREKVESYKIIEDAASSMDDTLEEIFYSSLDRATTTCLNEADEQRMLIMNLDKTLCEAGILQNVDAGRGILDTIGIMDFAITNTDDKVSIICECKSTHNLLLPMTAAECEEAYDTAYYQTNPFPKAWSNVAHPIGQLLRYMVDNEHCLGALTSGTRTYFLKIEFPEPTRPPINEVPIDKKVANHVSTRSQAKRRKIGETFGTPKDYHNRHSHSNIDDEIKVCISDAWFVGEANYLRAWAYVHNLLESMQTWQGPINWIASSTTAPTPEQRGSNPSGNNDIQDSATCTHDADDDKNDDGGGKLSNTGNMEYFYPLHHGALPFVPYNEIVKVGVLGQGRNGSCFKVKWNDTEYAMKQFDIGRYGDTYFEREVQAYMLLQDVWGILVPRPIFLSESYSGGVMFLGLQLGRASTSVDANDTKLEEILYRLRKEYGIRHNDPDGQRNMIIITDANGIERAAVIDFEDWDEVTKHH